MKQTVVQSGPEIRICGSLDAGAVARAAPAILRLFDWLEAQLGIVCGNSLDCLATGSLAPTGRLEFRLIRAA